MWLEILIATLKEFGVRITLTLRIHWALAYAISSTKVPRCDIARGVRVLTRIETLLATEVCSRSLEIIRLIPEIPTLS